MFVLCPQCQFLVALNSATGRLPMYCPRCMGRMPRDTAAPIPASASPSPQTVSAQTQQAPDPIPLTGDDNADAPIPPSSDVQASQDGPSHADDALAVANKEVQPRAASGIETGSPAQAPFSPEPSAAAHTVPEMPAAAVQATPAASDIDEPPAETTTPPEQPVDILLVPDIQREAADPGSQANDIPPPLADNEDKPAPLPEPGDSAPADIIQAEPLIAEADTQHDAVEPSPQADDIQTSLAGNEDEAASLPKTADTVASKPDVVPESGQDVPPPRSQPPPPAKAAPSFVRQPGAVTGMPPRRQRQMTVAISSLVLLLLLQLLLADRAQLAADARWRPALSALCGVLRCSLPPWREPSAFTLLQRDVRPHPTIPGALKVTATLRNDARWPQPWPALLLTLSDADGRTVGARAFMPAEYLGASAAERKSTQKMLASGQSTIVRLDIAEPSPRIVAFTFDFR